MHTLKDADGLKIEMALRKLINEPFPESKKRSGSNESDWTFLVSSIPILLSAFLPSLIHLTSRSSSYNPVSVIKKKENVHHPPLPLTEERAENFRTLVKINIRCIIIFNESSRGGEFLILTTHAKYLKYSIFSR